MFRNPLDQAAPINLIVFILGLPFRLRLDSTWYLFGILADSLFFFFSFVV